MSPPRVRELQLGLNAVSGSSTFTYNAALWSDPLATPFGADDTLTAAFNGVDILTAAFNGVRVSRVHLVLNDITADYALPDQHASKYTLQQLSNGRDKLQHLVQPSAGNAGDILLSPQPPVDAPSDTFQLGHREEADACAHHLFRQLAL